MWLVLVSPLQKMISFWSFQFEAIEEGEAVNRSVKVTPVMPQPRQRRGGVELEAFDPFSNFLASQIPPEIFLSHNYMGR